MPAKKKSGSRKSSSSRSSTRRASRPRTAARTSTRKKSSASSRKPARRTTTARARATSGNGQRRTSGSGGAKVTTDHDEIQRWAEQRGAQPATVRGTETKKGAGILRISFPGRGGDQALEPISWDEFFKKFDEKRLALLYQEKLRSGKESRFAKLVSRR